MNVRRFAVVVSALALLGLASAASAELTATMRVKSNKGEIKGGVTQKGREGAMAIVAFDHTLATPTDSATGMATGKRQHKPLSVTKAIDKASPLLRNALVNNEALSEVTIQFWQAAPASGAETNHFTIELTNARITSIKHVMLDNRIPESTRLAASEEITFTYETITWTWNDGGVTATDSFRSSAK